MAVTFTFTADAGGRQRVGRQHVLSGTLTADGTYTAGGDEVTPEAFGLGVVESLAVDGALTDGDAAYTATVEPIGDGSWRLLAFIGDDGAPGDEASASTDVSGFAVRVTARGR